METKEQMRKAVLAKRRTLSESFVLEASKKIWRHLFALEEFCLSERIGLYADFKNEVVTSEIFHKSHALRKEIFYPAVDPHAKGIHFYRVQKISELAPGYAGILEPAIKSHPLSSIQFLNLIVIPGVVFDRQGNRIGYGEGFYDRLLAHYKGKRVALAYDFQVCDGIAAELQDQRLDILVTEERVLRIL